MLRTKKKNFTPAEYLAMEEVAESKSEYYNGEIYAMAGGSADHSLIQGNLISALNQQLKRSPCRVFTSDMRLLVQRSEMYTYPDVMVVCGRMEFILDRTDTLTNPILIAEILSDSTRRYDRGQKFEFYKQIPSLQEYLVIESTKPRLERFRRGRKRWNNTPLAGVGASLALDSVRCEITAQEIYNKVSWLG